MCAHIHNASRVLRSPLGWIDHAIANRARDALSLRPNRGRCRTVATYPVANMIRPCAVIAGIARLTEPFEIGMAMHDSGFQTAHGARRVLRGDQQFPHIVNDRKPASEFLQKQPAEVDALQHMRCAECAFEGCVLSFHSWPCVPEKVPPRIDTWLSDSHVTRRSRIFDTNYLGIWKNLLTCQPQNAPRREILRTWEAPCESWAAKAVVFSK